MKKLMLITAVVLIAVISGIGIYWYFTKDVRSVKKQVANAAAIIRKKPSNLPHAGVLKFTKVDEIFSDKVDIRCVDPAFNAVLSREELKMIVSTVNRRIDHMDVAVGTIAVEINDDEADFSFDAEFSGSGSGRFEEFDRVYQVSGKALKRDGKWQISALTAESIVK